MPTRLYLGRQVDPATGELGARVDLDAADLLTHGLIVGMTGSGKTGLALVLIEEALRSGIPVLAVDPKGDLANLLLLFDSLAPADFEPWIDAESARRAGKGVPEAAAEAAERWKSGLADWGLTPADVAALRSSHEAVVFTPGSKAGVPLNVLQSLEAPALPFAEAEEDLRDEIAGLVGGMLSLVGIAADPVQSREAVLLANLVEQRWRSGEGYTLESLIAAVADPPLERLGALALESVFPRKERQALALSLNNLLAAPSFQAWREGEPLDVEHLLRAADGRPRLSILYTAHLADRERLFVTALALDKLKTWLRRQPGASGLRALVYMDEVVGYVPPHPANPPPKKPLLMLLKQARAQGLGVVLATQNPVDLDYKGLANMGTWLVGTLQTAQDRARLIEGLSGAGLEPAAVGRWLDSARKRVFLLHDVHREGPCLVHSRWAMCYLRGPLTREEVGRLMAGRTSAAAEPGAAARPRATAPVLPPPYRPLWLSRYGGLEAELQLFVKYAVRYKGADERIEARVYPLAAPSMLECLEAEPLAVEEGALSSEPPAGLRYAAPPAILAADGGKAVEKALRERLPDKLAAGVFFDPVSRETSAPGEGRDTFAARLREAGGGATAAKLQERLDKKRRDLAMREQELRGRRGEKWLAVGSALLRNVGLLSGRRKSVTGASAVLTKSRLEGAAGARVEALRADVAQLEAELAGVVALDPARFEEQLVTPGRSGFKLLRHELVWVH